jgi:hypothetical protein
MVGGIVAGVSMRTGYLTKKVGRVAKRVEMGAIVFPPCAECAAPYRPSKPIMDYGTVFFQSPDLVATVLFRIEQFFRDVRIARMRKV